MDKKDKDKLENEVMYWVRLFENKIFCSYGFLKPEYKGMHINRCIVNTSSQSEDIVLYISSMCDEWVYIIDSNENLKGIEFKANNENGVEIRIDPLNQKIKAEFNGRQLHVNYKDKINFYKLKYLDVLAKGLID